MLWQHDPAQPIGIWDEVREDGMGLWVKGRILTEVYQVRPGLAAGSRVPDDPELPLPLNKVHPIHEVVHIDYFLPGCPPSADAFWRFLTDLMAGRTPHLGHGLIHYD